MNLIGHNAGYTKESNYLYAIPLKEFYTDQIRIGTKSTIAPYHIPYTKGCHLFCTAPLDSQFLRVAVAVKNKVYMLAYKHAANLTVNGSPITPVTSPNPTDSFIKHRVSGGCGVGVVWVWCGCGVDMSVGGYMCMCMHGFKG